MAEEEDADRQQEEVKDKDKARKAVETLIRGTEACTLAGHERTGRERR